MHAYMKTTAAVQALNSPSLNAETISDSLRQFLETIMIIIKQIHAVSFTLNC